jgi:nitric oxide reductase activation protein
MKTQLSNRSLRRLAILAVAAVSLNVGLIAQPSPVRNAPVPASIVRLENLMNASEQSLKYNAPDASTAEQQIELAIQNLNQITKTMEAGLKYNAPMQMEEEAIQNLDLLAESNLKELKYEAPVHENATMGNQTLPSMRAKAYKTPQDVWLINAGYYKNERTPSWTKVKKILNDKSSNEELCQ